MEKLYHFFFFISCVHLFYGMTNGIFFSLFNFVSLFMFLLYLMYIKHKKCLHTGAFTNVLVDVRFFIFI